ncbi:hypothetical protein DYB31_003430 [Aphanomyces astaci]|uniref:DDE-1 domain-containing protein n=1 Tax=Aphanomyces astaci TaxID=112090 RepID=A0A397FDZ6_APHAT|nr:hypothetical protein DYB31_003430 [Aphanomyces astaci]
MSQRAALKSRSKDRDVCMPELETKILSWVLRCEELGVCVTGELIRKQAKAYYDEYQLVTNWPLKITLALTTNANGTDMVEPLFIGSAVQPRCFGGRSAADLGFDYTSSKKAWMNGDIFDTYLRKLDSRMEAASRNILLLVDNASPHKAKEDTLLTNVSLKMLPPNTTAYLQPQDAGIIASFKAKIKLTNVQLEHNHLFHTSYEKAAVPVALKVKRCLVGDDHDNRSDVSDTWKDDYVDIDFSSP